MLLANMSLATAIRQTATFDAIAIRLAGHQTSRANAHALRITHFSGIQTFARARRLLGTSAGRITVDADTRDNAFGATGTRHAASSGACGPVSLVWPSRHAGSRIWVTGGRCAAVVGRRWADDRVGFQAQALVAAEVIAFVAGITTALVFVEGRKNACADGRIADLLQTEVVSTVAIQAHRAATRAGFARIDGHAGVVLA